MSAALVAEYPLIDFSNDHDTVIVKNVTQEHETAILIDDQRGSEDSEESEAEATPSAVVHLEREKSQAQREAFQDFLRTSKGVDNEAAAEDYVDRQDHTDSNPSGRDIEAVRRYQQELFERALEENVIAVLDTGSGKTLVACLLIRHVLAEELIHRSQGVPPRVIFFLANSVHLVQQQARVLANNLLKRPLVFVGDDKAEVWKQPTVWPKVIDDCVPIVCTPAVLQQCLDAALIRIEQISLIVFDEAHHAKKNHPYSRIMRSHYMRCDFELRPKLFGMTASPVDSKGNIDTNATDLEELLHCKIVTADDPSKLSFAPKPKDVIWRYDKLFPRGETELFSSIWTKLAFARETKKGFIFAKEAVATLGPWCADRVWRYVIGASEHEAAGVVKRFEQSPAYAALENIEQREIALRNVQEAVMLVLSHNLKMPTPDSSSLSSKVLRLYNELQSFYSENPQTRAIVFVDQRFTAQVLSDCFSHLKIPNLRTGILLGAAQDSTSLKKQELFLNHFRNGLINLIFATSVADEGIDIPQCNLCIRFDLYKSPIQYIQSRGRARMTGSIYVHMIEDGKKEHEANYDYVIRSDQYLKEYCQQLAPNRLLGRGTKLEKLLARDSNNKSFKTSGGAICDFDNSLLVLARFASSLHYLGAIERETFEEEIDESNKLFRYIVRLPKLAEVNVSGARGEWKSNKTSAKRSAAWNCCVLLRKNQLLDEALNSPFRKLKPENLNARLAVSEKKSAYQMITKPSMWQEHLGEIPTRLHIALVRLQPKAQLQYRLSPIVVLTRMPLPSFPTFVLYLEQSIETETSVSVKSTSVAVSADEVDLLTNFTLNGVFADVFNKTYQMDSKRLSYWLAPPSKTFSLDSSNFNDIVDTEMVQAVNLGRIKWSPGCEIDGIWTNKFICDPRNGKYHYFSGDVVPGANIYDPVPASAAQIAGKSAKNIIDFSDSFWRASKKNFVEATYDPNQSILSAKLITARRNFLETFKGAEQPLIDCLIAPQPLEVSRIDPAFAASCLAWPAIIHRLESYLITSEAFAQLDLPGVSADLALEAFTKDTDVEDQENQMHAGAQHSAGKNYERLEFIGDSLLKMMTTITVFNRTKCDEEGMHCRRMEILCNRRLFEVSTEKHHLHRYIRTSGFNRVTWYPENLVLLKGRGAKTIPEPVKHPNAGHDLGMKTIADVSEAIIGAAVTASRGSPNRFDLGIKAITLLVDSEDHAITSWSQIAEMYEPPEWSLKMDDVQANKLADDIAEKLGYRFRHPRLLKSAFTHSSETHATVPDLQRLEFLGDAVLDWVSISWLFDKNPDRNPQWLTEHKMAMVSNKFLAALAIVLDFDKFIYCTTAKLFADISLYAKRVREAFAEKDVDRDFWTHIDSPPKALSDLVESYLGAVLVDSNFNYEEVEKFFMNHVVWFFEDISKYDSFANRHPTTYLYKKVGEEFKCRNFNVIVSEPQEGLVEIKITAGVLIHNKVIADASGTSSRYAKVRASQKALTKLKDMQIQDFRSTFGCDCKVRAE